MKLKNITTKIGSGATPKGGKGTYKTEGISLIRSMNVYDSQFKEKDLAFIDDEQAKKLSNVEVKSLDVLLNITGASVARCCLVPEQILPARVNQHVVIIRVKKELADPRFIYMCLVSPKYKARLLSLAQGGATREALTKVTIEEFELDLPSLVIQKSIADTYLTYDNLIENNNRRISILEDMAQSLYREWFVNFRYPDHVDALDTSSPNALVENQGKPKLIDSSLGQIPEGWEVKRLDDYVVLQRGFDLPKRNRNEEGGIPIYAASGITGYHDQVKAKGPGIVTGRSGTLGIVNLVLEDHWPLNTSLWVKEFKNCSAHYAYYLLDGIGLERFNSGASVPTLNRNDVHGSPVIAPPNELIEKFESIASANHKQIHLLKRKNENLKQQRDMLLPKLISGQIELKD
jgi:type I restriction enzyme S subunit